MSRRSPVSTLMVTAPSEALCDELLLALEDTKKHLTNLLSQSLHCTESGDESSESSPSGGSPESCASVLPGGGEWQRIAAARLRDELRLFDFPSNDASLLYETKVCLDLFITCLEETARCLSERRRAAQNFDSFVLCKRALQVAVEAAITVLDIDGELTTQPQVLRNEG
jgi:hypothetical protein